MTKHKRYWWRADGAVIYGEWTGVYAARLMWICTSDGKLWGVPEKDINSEDSEDWAYKSEKRIV